MTVEMRSAWFRFLVVFVALAVLGATPPDPTRDAAPPPSPRMTVPDGPVLFSDAFDRGLDLWKPDKDGVWSVRNGTLRGDLPDRKQQRSVIAVADSAWQDIAVDLDVCATRGVDKGVVIRMEGNAGIAVDLRGPGYDDVVLHRRQHKLGGAQVVNANGEWHHIRIEAVGPRYRVFVNGKLAIEKVDEKRMMPGRVALAAYTGGVGTCTVYYDNIVVTALSSTAVAPAGGQR
jgi:hypothetical protein